MASQPYKTRGYCGHTLTGKIWRSGTSVECEIEDVKIVMHPKMEIEFIPSKICAFCKTRVETKLRMDK